MNRRLAVGFVGFFATTNPLIGYGGSEQVVEENCALNVTYTVFRLFGRQESTNTLADSLGLDSSHSKMCSFADIKRTVEGNGLSATGYKIENALSLNSITPKSGVAIVRTQSGGTGKTTSHFIVFVPSGSNVLLFDPSTRQSLNIVAADLPRQRWMLNMTGEILVIAEPNSASGGLKVLDPKIELADQSADQEKIAAKIRFRNASDRPIRLAEPRGSCGCIERFEWPRGEIEPGQMGEVIAYFDPTKLDDGMQSKQVFVGEEGRETHSQIIPIKFKLSRPPKTRQSELSMPSIEFGRQADSWIATKSTRVLLTIPNDGTDPKSATVAIETPPALNITVADDQLCTNGDRLIGYSLKWTDPPRKGEFKYVVQWTVTRPGKPPEHLSLPLTGDVYEAHP